MMACVASQTTTATASPSATYVYKQETSTPDGLPIEIEIGFKHPGGPVSGNAFGGGFASLTKFWYRIGSVEVDLQDLKDLQATCYDDDQCQPNFLEYELSPEEGSLSFTSQEIYFFFRYGDGRLWGQFRTDAPEPQGCFEEACSYAGSFAVVPAPSALALLGVGLLGLAWNRRRAG